MIKGWKRTMRSYLLIASKIKIGIVQKWKVDNTIKTNLWMNNFKARSRSSTFLTIAINSTLLFSKTILLIPKIVRLKFPQKRAIMIIKVPFKLRRTMFEEDRLSLSTCLIKCSQNSWKQTQVSSIKVSWTNLTVQINQDPI